MPNVDELLEEIEQTLRESHNSNVVWRALTVSPAPRGRNAAINRFPSFFDATIRAHASSIYTTLSRLFDADPNTRSLRTLIREAHQQRFINQVVAHSDSKQSPDSVFASAGLTPNDLSSMIEAAFAAFNAVLEGVEMDPIQPSDDTAAQTALLLRVLSR